MRKFYNIVEDNKAPNVQSLWLHNGSLSYFGSNGWETVGDAASLEELGNKVDSLNNEINFITDDIDNIYATLENIPSGGSYTEITWQELKNLRDNSQLSAGSLYRITDYQCTTVQENTRSAGHQFDIIVLALTNNTLSEQAWAAYSRDTYFKKQNLSAWKLWYCLDNDTTRFNWADNTSGNGRGVIYRMIDEYNNDVPYDFKNIQFIDTTNTLEGYFYTFNQYTSQTTDSSIKSYVKNNFLGLPKQNGNKINNIIFIGTNTYNNIFSSSPYNSIIIGSITNNIVWGSFFNNTITRNFEDNFISGTFNSNEISSIFSYNTIAGYFENNIIGVSFSQNTVFQRLSNCKIQGNLTCSANTFFRNSYLNINCSNESGFGSVRYYVFTPALNKTQSPKSIDLENMRNYETKIGVNSNGELKQWCEADLVG